MLEARTFASAVALNDGQGPLHAAAAPVEAQFAPVYAVVAEDFDRRGRIDLLLGGNFHGVPPMLGRYDASYGLLLRGGRRPVRGGGHGAERRRDRLARCAACGRSARRPAGSWRSRGTPIDCCCCRPGAHAPLSSRERPCHPERSRGICTRCHPERSRGICTAHRPDDAHSLSPTVARWRGHDHHIRTPTAIIGRPRCGDARRGTGDGLPNARAPRSPRPSTGRPPRLASTTRRATSARSSTTSRWRASSPTRRRSLMRVLARSRRRSRRATRASARVRASISRAFVAAALRAAASAGGGRSRGHARSMEEHIRALWPALTRRGRLGGCALVADPAAGRVRRARRSLPRGLLLGLVLHDARPRRGAAGPIS